MTKTAPTPAIIAILPSTNGSRDDEEEEEDDEEGGGLAPSLSCNT